MAWQVKTKKIGDETVAVLGPKGNIMCVDDQDSSKEQELNAPELFYKMLDKNREIEAHRKRADENEVKLKPYEGIDPEKARAALTTVQGLNDKQFIEAGKANEAREAAVKAAGEKFEAERKAFQTQLDEMTKKTQGLQGDLDREIIGGGFARSKYISDKVAIPRTFVEAKFRGAFKVVDGKAVAHDQHGQPIYGRQDPTAPAPFDEALELLIGRDPDKDSILVGSRSSGSGAQHQGGGGGAGGRKTISRQDFRAMKPHEQAALMAQKERPNIVD